MDSEKIMDFENMNLSALKDKTYVVAVSTGDRSKCKILASTLHGPYDFLEMVEAVGNMWVTHQHHAKVTVLEKDVEKLTNFLDENTTDYIEAKWQEIISDTILLGDDADKKYTCEASITRDSENTEDNHE